MGIPFSSPCWGIKMTSKFFFCENFFSWPKKWPKFIFLAIFWPLMAQKNYLPLKKSQRIAASFDTPPRSLAQKLKSLQFVLCRARCCVHTRTFWIFAHFFFLEFSIFRKIPSTGSKSGKTDKLDPFFEIWRNFFKRYLELS